MERQTADLGRRTSDLGLQIPFDAHDNDKELRHDAEALYLQN